MTTFNPECGDHAMTTYDAELAALRDRLRTAIETDVRRARRRRRRLLQVTIVPAVLAAGTGVAAGVAPLLGEPAPAPVQQQFDDTASDWPGYTGAPLQVVARADGHTLYGTTRATNGGWCLDVDEQDNGSINCQAADFPRADEVFVATIGGPNAVIAGRVGTPRARSISFRVRHEDHETRIGAAVGRDGFFIAGLPEPLASRLATDSPMPSVAGVAYDASGKPVAAVRRP